MAGLAGKAGAFYLGGDPDVEIGGCFNWSLDIEHDLEDVTTFSSDCWRERVATLASFTISAEAYWADESFLDNLGVDVICKLFVNETSDVFYYGKAKVSGDSIELEVGSIVQESIELQGNGEIEYSGNLQTFTMTSSGEPTIVQNIRSSEVNQLFIDWGDETSGTYEIDTADTTIFKFRGAAGTLTGKGRNITRIELVTNAATEIDVTELVDLIRLSAAFNGLTELDISTLINLTYLDVRSNSFNQTNLDIILNALPIRLVADSAQCFIDTGIASAGAIAAAQAKNWTVTEV